MTAHMDVAIRRGVCWLLLCALTLGCSFGATSSTPSERPSSTLRPDTGSGFKRITAAIMGDPRTLRNTVNTAGGAGEAPGIDTVQELLHVGTASTDGRGRLNARLAEDVPSTDNGLCV